MRSCKRRHRVGTGACSAHAFVARSTRPCTRATSTTAAGRSRDERGARWRWLRSAPVQQRTTTRPPMLHAAPTLRPTARPHVRATRLHRTAAAGRAAASAPAEARSTGDAAADALCRARRTAASHILAAVAALLVTPSVVRAEVCTADGVCTVVPADPETDLARGAQRDAPVRRLQPLMYVRPSRSASRALAGEQGKVRPTAARQLLSTRVPDQQAAWRRGAARAV